MSDYVQIRCWHCGFLFPVRAVELKLASSVKSHRMLSISRTFDSMLYCIHCGAGTMFYDFPEDEVF